MFDYQKTVILATQNQGKVQEMQEPLQSLGYKVIGLRDLPHIFTSDFDVEETGTSFMANAILKAEAVAKASQLIAIADDSGLEVDALNNAPGIYSARYAMDMPNLSGQTQDERNIQKLLATLSKIPLAERSGRFCCAMCAVNPHNPKQPLEAFATWEGRIISNPCGKNGFGYDPIFFDPELGLTAAQMPRKIKMQRSHRAKAIQLLIEKWPKFISQTPA